MILSIFSCAYLPYISSLVNYLKLFACSKKNRVVCFPMSFEIFIYLGYKIFIRHVTWNHFFPGLCLAFNFLNIIFERADIFNLMKSNLPIFSFMVHDFYVLRNLCLTQGNKDFLLFFSFSKSFIVLALMLNSVSHFE